MIIVFLIESTDVQMYYPLGIMVAYLVKQDSFVHLHVLLHRLL